MTREIRPLVLEDILNEKQICHVVKQCIAKDVQWDLKGSEVKPAMDGIAGFLGDHIKATLTVAVEGELKEVHLFCKRLPADNKPKAEFIDKHNFFKREKLMYHVLRDFEDGPNPWCVKAYIYTESLMVMPDLSKEGYSTQNFLNTLDENHILVTLTSVARFHAAFLNYDTKKNLIHPYSIFQENSTIFTDTIFCDSPWLNACAKLSVNILRKFSGKSYRNLPDLQLKLKAAYLRACDSLSQDLNKVNVLLHRDLWINNIMFKYDKGVPLNAVLVDYQCMSYGPPAFDVMMLLYLTADRTFRKQREQLVFDHYYSIFSNNLDSNCKKRLKDLGYDKKAFLNLCERARMFGMFLAVAIYPFILMDPKTAQKTFDDPDTFEKFFTEDRSAPVIDHASKCHMYRNRNLEVTEEFLERFVLKQM